MPAPVSEVLKQDLHSWKRPLAGGAKVFLLLVGLPSNWALRITSSFCVQHSHGFSTQPPYSVLATADEEVFVR